jgi:hypothetical protein
LVDTLFPKSVLQPNSREMSKRVKNKLSEFKNRDWNFVSVAADQELNTPMRELERINKVRRRVEGEADPHQGPMQEEPVQACRIPAYCGRHARGRGRGGGAEEEREEE